MTIPDARNHARLDTKSLGRFGQWSRRGADSFNVFVAQLCPLVQDDVLALTHNLKVLPSVVTTVSIDVMNDLRPKQQASKIFLSNKSVFGNIAARVCVGMIGAFQIDMPATRNSSTLPARMFTPVCTNRGIAAGHGAKSFALTANRIFAMLTENARLLGHRALLRLVPWAGAVPAVAGPFSACNSTKNDVMASL